MIHFDEVDFSESHSEELISFFWRSVYEAYATVKPVPLIFSEIVFPTAVPDPPSDFNYHHSGIFSDGINARVRTGVRNCSGINNLASR